MIKWLRDILDESDKTEMPLRNPLNFAKIEQKWKAEKAECYDVKCSIIIILRWNLQIENEKKKQTKTTREEQEGGHYSK